MTVNNDFNLAIKNHQQNNLEIAENLYSKILKIEPNHIATLNNLGTLFIALGKYQKAKDCYERVIKISPNNADIHNNLGSAFKKLHEYEKAINSYKKAIQINPGYASVYHNLGIVYQVLNEHQKAIGYFKKAIEIDPRHASYYFNIAFSFDNLGDKKSAENYYQNVIEIDENYIEAYNNLGNVFSSIGELKKAKDYYKKAIKINPTFALAHWNLYGITSNIDEALIILKKVYEIDNKHIKSKIMISALLGFKGNFNSFNDILASSESNHSYTRSIKWIFSLPQLPKIYFNRWDFFDAVISLSENSRPFYEFGVWTGSSFKYLINTFKKGYGFDTFNGLPENWHDEPKGSYSSHGEVPEIEGGEFIVGKFEDTLPKFFSKKKPIASIINFDADLYSSTLCALSYSNKVIDEKTILVFDEFIINKNWEEDEYKALNEFCDGLGYRYKVIAISFFTKQVAVKLIK